MSEKQDIRLTQTTLRILEVFMSDITKEISGADIWSATKIGAGSRYPILARLENAGWLISHWEKIDASEQGRPRRRYYRLTLLGQSRAHAALLDRGFGGMPAWSR